jgi:nucleotide-binding universal stress UspA family protein
MESNMRGRSSLLTGLSLLLVSLVIIALGGIAGQGGILSLGGVVLGAAAGFLAYSERSRRRISAAELTPDPQGEYKRILVPLRFNDIGDEILVTALRLAEEQQAAVVVLNVIQVPRREALDGDMPEADAEANRQLAQAQAVAADIGVAIEVEVLRARDRGHAICEAAARHGCDLIVMGSANRWRKQSRLLSPAADHVVRHAPCQVTVVSYPEHAFADAG